MRLFGLIGYPLGHSFSKEYFTSKFQREGIADCGYELFPIRSIHELKNLVEVHKNLEGLNITIPYKQVALSKIDDLSNLPKGLNACNCIKIINGKTLGFNTDVIGFEKSFSRHLQPHHRSALILGNGGAAEAVKFCLEKLGIEYQIVSRQLKLGSHLTYEDLTEEIIRNSPIIINTTPLGTYPQMDQCPDIPYEAINEGHYLFDLVYNPPKTVFLSKGETHGATIQNGYEMLVIQAEESWRIWNEK